MNLFLQYYDQYALLSACQLWISTQKPLLKIKQAIYLNCLLNIIVNFLKTASKMFYRLDLDQTCDSINEIMSEQHKQELLKELNDVQIQLEGLIKKEQRSNQTRILFARRNRICQQLSKISNAQRQKWEKQRLEWFKQRQRLETQRQRLEKQRSKWEKQRQSRERFTEMITNYLIGTDNEVEKAPGLEGTIQVLQQDEKNWVCKLLYSSERNSIEVDKRRHSIPIKRKPI